MLKGDTLLASNIEPFDLTENLGTEPPIGSIQKGTFIIGSYTTSGMGIP